MDAQAVATKIVKTLVDAGYTAYFAGGWVRDHLLGEARSDIDIATEAPPEKVMELFSRTIPVGVNFGVVVVVEEGFNFEVSSFRREGLYVDGRRPQEVQMATPEEDVARRDFTINGMFYNPLTGDIIDYVGGREDLQQGIVRAIGEAHERFVEDRLRMIRAVRIACRFQFTMDPETEKAIIANAATLFPAVAMERVWQEFGKMAKHPHFAEALVTMHRLGLLPIIFPQLRELSVEEIEKRVASFAAFPDNAPLIFYLIELFPDAPLEQQQELCSYLKATNRDIKLIEMLDEARALMQCTESVEKVCWARFYARDNADMCLNTVSARWDSTRRQAFESEDQKRREVLANHVRRIRERKPLISSSILKEEGIAPGPLMGRLLGEAERIAVNEDFDDPSELLRRLKISALWP